MNFEFYVLNYDFNKKEIERFNIFQNSRVQEATEKEVKKYVRSPKKYKREMFNFSSEPYVIYGFEAFCEELRSIIAWQERGRCEYEIVVGGYPYHKGDELTKLDCYHQAEKNIPMIAREVIYQYKKYLKEKK